MGLKPGGCDLGKLSERLRSLTDRVFDAFREDLEWSPFRQLRHPRHSERHRAGRVDDPGIRGILEPECHHMVLTVRGPNDDRSIDFAG